MATKLNKSQIWEMVSNTIEVHVTANTAVKKGQDTDLINELLAALQPVLAPKQGGGSSDKINEAGEIYCNYFEMYRDPSDFNKKLSKPNKNTGERQEVYKANCTLAEQILRKVKTLKTNVTKQATDAMRTKLISIDEFNEILDNIEAAANEKYGDANDVPAVSDIIGLTETLTGSDKPERG